MKVQFSQMDTSIFFSILTLLGAWEAAKLIFGFLIFMKDLLRL